MTPSLPSLPATAPKSGLQPGGATEIQINQSDNTLSTGFEGLLGDAYTALSPGAQTPLPAPPGVQQPFDALQSLPPDGRLLPLLQQTLDRLADVGMDPQQFAERLNARLKALAQNSELQPADQLVAALQQLMQEQPVLKSVLPGEVLARLAGYKATTPVLADNTTASALNGLPEQVRRAAGSGIEADHVPVKPAQPALIQAAKPATPDSTLSQLQQQPLVSEQRQPELAVVMAALKRMAGGNRPAAVEKSPVRSELSATGVASPALAATAAHTASVTAGVPTVSINTPLGQAGWDQALGERIQWLAGQKVQGAQIKLNPANLGPMEVRIQVHNDQASVQFAANQPVVREALEAALPRLRDLFEASGVQLVDVDVSSGGESFAERQEAMQDAVKPYRGTGYGGDEAASDTPLETPLAGFAVRGYLDLFA